jgi:hypothetical protein
LVTSNVGVLDLHIETIHIYSGIAIILSQGDSYLLCDLLDRMKADHTLPKKLNVIASDGFKAIELSMPDIPSFASQHLQKEVGRYDFDDLVTASKAIREI